MKNKDTISFRVANKEKWKSQPMLPQIPATEIDVFSSFLNRNKGKGIQN
jgi:hypothetical protein